LKIRIRKASVSQRSRSGEMGREGRGNTGENEVVYEAQFYIRRVKRRMYRHNKKPEIGPIIPDD
jgi:hypothetical protein